MVRLGGLFIKPVSDELLKNKYSLESSALKGLSTYCVALVSLLSLSAARADLVWSELPPLPDSVGFAGSFAGISNDTLLVAGGANFPDGAPWDGGSKVWHDRIFALKQNASEWQEVGKLPRPLGYGVSISTPQGVICIGGSDERAHYAEVLRLKYNGAELEIENLPPLPVALANMAGALVDGTIHVIGGTSSPNDSTASNLHLAFNGHEWSRLDPLPAAGRILPVASSHQRRFLVFSGASLAPDTEGNAARTYLKDAWAYQAGTGWSRLSDSPRAMVAAPSPAPLIGFSHLLFVGGDDGSLAGFQPRSKHPGFTRETLTYNTTTDAWSSSAPLSSDLLSPVTTTVVEWSGGLVLPSGEVRPAVRSPQVLRAEPMPSKTHFGSLNWSIVALYLTGMIGVGVYFMKREAASSTEAYFRGGQRVPAWVAGLSIFATMLSALTFMGIPARAYQTDISWYIGQLTILLVIPLVAVCYLPFFRKLDLTSAYEYLERRFSLPCRLFAALSFICFHLGRIAIVLYLPALALAAVSDIDVITAVAVIGVLCVIYTVIGGIEAVVWTDAIQAIVLMAGALLCFALAVCQVDGGLVGMVDIARVDNKLLDNLQWDSLSIADGTTSVLVLFIAFFFNSLVPYTSSQDVVQRYVTTRNLSAARKSLKVTMWMSVFGSLVFFLLGTAIYAFYKTHPDRLDSTLPASDSILPFYIVCELPIGISGLVIAAIFAAAQSTVSSSLNSIATSFVKDFDSRLLRPNREDHTYLRSAQTVVVVAGLIGIGIAVTMARSDIESAFKTFNSMIGLTAGSLGGLFALGVFTRRAHGAGALIGALSGLATVIVIHLSAMEVTGLLYAFIGFATSFLVGWILSLALPGKANCEFSLHRS